MPFNGSGTYAAPGSTFNPAVATTTISATDWNALLADLTTALSTCMLKDGQQTPTANIAMGGFKLTGLAAGTGAGNSVRYEQVGLLSGANAWAANQPMVGFKFTGLAAGSANGDSIRYEQSPAAILTTTGDIVYASGANTPARLAIGTAGLPLVVNAGATAPQWGFANQNANLIYAGPSSGAAAAPSFRALTIADGAAYSWVSSATVSNQATLGLFWTAAQASAVDVIEIEFVGLANVNNNQGTLARLSTDGSTFDSNSVYQWTNQYQQSNPASTNNAGSAGLVSSIQFIQQSNNAAAATSSGHAFLFQPSNASITKMITGKTISVTSSNGVQDCVFGGEYTTTTALRGIQVFAGTGNISGTLYAKGRLKA